MLLFLFFIYCSENIYNLDYFRELRISDKKITVILRNKFLKLLNQHETVVLFPIFENDIEKYDEVIKNEDHDEFADSLINLNPKVITSFNSIGCIFKSKIKKHDLCINIRSKEVIKFIEKVNQEEMIYMIIIIKKKDGYKIVKGSSFYKAEQENKKRSYKIKFIFFKESLFFTKN